MTEKKAPPRGQPEGVAEKAAQAKELLNRVHKDIAAVLKPDRFVRFLDTLERFHWFSYVNILLIMEQFPAAEYLAGYDVWKKTSLSMYNDPERKILTAENHKKAIRLVAPFTVLDGSTRSLINVVVPAYDIKQTNGLPRPENDFLDLSKCSCMDIVNAIGFVAPYRTTHAASEDPRLSYNTKGYCNHETQQFVVDSRLSVKGLLSVLLHEYAVASLHLSNYKNTELQSLVEESVYYVLAKHFILPVEDITFSYVVRLKDAPVKSIAEALYLIQMLSHIIIEKIEEHLEYLAALSPITEDIYQANFFDDLEFGSDVMPDEI